MPAGVSFSMGLYSSGLKTPLGNPRLRLGFGGSIRECGLIRENFGICKPIQISCAARYIYFFNNIVFVYEISINMTGCHRLTLAI